MPNSVRLKDEKPLLDMHMFGSAKLEVASCFFLGFRMGLPKRPVRKVEVMQGRKLLPKSRARPWGIQTRNVSAHIDRWIHGWMDGRMDGCTDSHVRID